MLNIIKMDLYRMFRTKSLYVIWIIAAVLMIGTTYLLKAENTADEFEAASQQEIEESYTEDMPALGIQVMIPAGSDGKITVKDIFYGNAQSKFYVLFLVIFTVIFVMADINSGYIKNIGGQIQNRGYLVIAKAISLLVYTVLTMAAMVLVQILACRLTLGYGIWRYKRFSGVYGDSDTASLCIIGYLHGSCNYPKEQCGKHGYCNLPVHGYDGYYL